MKRSIIALTVLAAVASTGCASLGDAGHVAYTVRSYTDQGGKRACCELAVADGKEFEGRTIQFRTDGTGAMFTVQEGESKAFKGQGIAAKAASVLPVNVGEVLK